ncbi:nitroreductase family protein [Sporolactobacillus inulinus]|jgi:predicted oxidoreductase (fatty acid repression mutant protein)|uniref:Nitroreductase family protein n=2 Tax=Sporolactobacillus inulinus TaxID=2078 RepID=A0A4Y1ZI48_9BACL|nr:nitroreductase family protein [Sporolactobacillus inulinus]KLI02143.1 nitroreductase [Sporolactobacillus inulinus CASD]GAY78862.1 nitroreductase family protein [Sporolactobacillus inulinus]GEB78052.1 nitroreductase [Sporolactobacillus inulinus]
MSETFIDALKKRRSIYALDKNVKASKEEIVKAIQEAVKYAPSAFNSQSAHAVVLFGDESAKIWGEGGFAEAALRKVIPEGQSFESTAQKLASFNAGVGTVLFYEDQDVVKGLQEKFALYADNFPIWSEHSTGIAQFSVWTALAELGVGASLQHYNPLIDEAVQKEFDIPASWKLRAQMPFGNIAAPAAEKDFAPIDERVKVIG